MNQPRSGARGRCGCRAMAGQVRACRSGLAVGTERCRPRSGRGRRRSIDHRGGPPESPRARQGGWGARGRVSRRVAVELVLVGLCLLSAPATAALASTAPALPVGVSAGSGQVLAMVDSVDQVLTNVRNWLMGILAGLATVFATIGGVRYVLAAGDPGEVEKAKSAFRSAGFGYALAALAPLLVSVLRGLVGA